MAQDQAEERWRPARAPIALDDVLAWVQGLDPTARLVGDAAPGVRVDGLTCDSRTAAPGDLFVALPGASLHGVDRAPDARRAGAVAVLADRPAAGLPTLLVRDARDLLGPLSAWLHGEPSRAVAVHGVTGTNGKTSTAHLLAAALAAGGRPTALAGTLGMRTPRRRRESRRTTAEAPVVQELLATARDDGATDVVLEVSSHALALDRVVGTRFRTAVFTNLSPDHLELHHDVESYYAAKASLFVPERTDLAVIGVDDEHGRRLARETRCPVVTVSAAGRDATWWAGSCRVGLDGSTFRLVGPGTDRWVRLRLLGAHQVDNALAAIVAAVASGVAVDDAVAGVEALDGVPGRLERIDAGQPFAAFVDFAHNPGGHRRLLPFLRSLTEGRVVVVLGLTGERDPAKRAELGAVVAGAADVVVVTDESAHSEDPAALRAALAEAARARHGAAVHVEADRGRALALAVDAAGPGDVLVVVGRGTDTEMVAGTTRRPFDDRAVLRAALGARARPVTASVQTRSDGVWHG
ncbi:Mur ligase family protein [Actinomycetospora lemnae]|uniref:UDP-N-acetylmuramyl-tripeptide synthetase n=1 Tax=Actinomycetospora lemnae TaxID=3019891 RepID=A0ABT5T4Y4_9PSEU|nr:UDP-N-acetylmuramoyl-L-alanyl-D-glutamate--2,6-diaminopimelate ligase [Actinomycetospora sp. DW7H6]MDD7968973.1 UDP-N-acetylmuramoyl-L-alanyl-D-glutamate--2,6-diaminopimelate ligase [Actinomycetospora sp. DW7H6]